MSELEQEHLLIDLIQHYSFLYDKSSKYFKDNNKKNNAWDAIAAAMTITVDEAQRMWKNLRERYARENKLMKSIASGAEAPDLQWPLYKYMGFMDKHIVSRKRATNVVSRPTSSCSSGSSLAPTPLISPTGAAPHVWSSIDCIVGGEPLIELTGEENVLESEGLAMEDISPVLQPPKRLKRSVIDDPQIPTTSGTPRSTPKSKTDAVVVDSLGALTSYLKGKKKPDKNMAFGEYVGLTLMEMPAKEQNYKKLKIVEILNQPLDD